MASGASALDIFSIQFSTEGLKSLEEEIKQNEKHLDAYEQKIKDLEGVLDSLDKAGGTATKTYLDTAKELKVARREADNYKKSIAKLKDSSQYSFAQMQKSAASLLKTLGLFAVVRATMTKSLEFYEQAEQLDFLAQKTGIAAEELQKLSNISKRYGGTTEGTATSVENIRTNREEYQKAGIRIEQDPTKTLENVAKKMEQLKSDTEKWQLADSLGIDEATTRLLIEGADKFNESLKKTSKYKLYTKEDIQRMRDYRQIQQDIRDGTNNIFGAIAKLLLPAITAVSKAIRVVTDWLAEHEGAVKIIATMAAVALAIGGVKLAIVALNAALAFLMANPVVLTILAWAAGIAILIAVIQDFITWLNGGESALSGLWAAGAKVFDALKQKAGEFINALKGLWDAIPEPLKKLFGMASPITAAYTAVTTGKEIIAQANSNPANAVPTGAQGDYYNAQSQNQTTTENAQYMSPISNKNVQANITINTQASDPRAVAKEVGETMNSLDNGQIA